MDRKFKSVLLGLWIMMVLSVSACTSLKSADESEGTVESKAAATSGSEAELSTEESMTGLAIEEGYISIYYVEGDRIESEEEYLLFRGEDVFEAWKQKNGLGEEVRRIHSYTEDNGEESTYEFQGQMIASYKVGDYFVFNIVISSEIEDYFDSIDRELLLSSLEQTYRGYSIVDYDEFHIIIE